MEIIKINKKSLTFDFEKIFLNKNYGIISQELEREIMG